MLGLSANLNYYLFNGNVDLQKESSVCVKYKERDVRQPERCINAHMFMSRNRKVVKILPLRTRFLCPRETSCHLGVQKETCV